MPFFVIRGTFQVAGYSPDGDSLKFKASKPSLWKKLSGPMVETNAKGHAQLRFEGIDTPETHYQGQHQPRTLADAATDFAMAKAGITQVVWTANRYRVQSANDGVPGYILSRAAEKFHRPVAFVFAGACPWKDGALVQLTPAHLKKSLNYKLVANGHAYPTYYEELFWDLRNTLTAAVTAARKSKLPLWKADRTPGVTVSSQTSISDRYMIMPKLFRRLTDYLRGHNGKVRGFHAWLQARKEKVFVLPQGQATHIDTLIRQRGNRLEMTVRPEYLIFEP